MKKWIISSIFLLFITFLGVAFYMYQLVREPLTEAYEQVLVYVENEQLLNDISDISYYHGTETYYVITGEDEDGDMAYLWLKEDLSFYDLYKQSDGITAEAAMAIVNQDYGAEEVVQVRLGYERKMPAYEVMFIDDENRQSYYYVTFEDGAFMKRYHLNRD
ncbi:DUF5590 domain-containing protein [Alkalihalobacillus sp. 1P02AB]|uniref:cell wall elongation regulator TseB-like domain-containing protein n=1 Tax=Alkalihalobacillus sp. 1P02AB TaxID=3132260 RepID=UPI0039A54532